MNKSYIFSAIAAFALLTLSACHDDTPDGKTTEESQEFTISTKPLTANEVIGNDYENINNWKRKKHSAPNSPQEHIQSMLLQIPMTGSMTITE